MQRLYVEAWLPQHRPQGRTALALNALKSKDISELSCINKQKNLCIFLKIDSIDKVSSCIKLRTVVELESFFFNTLYHWTNALDYLNLSSFHDVWEILKPSFLDFFVSFSN